MKDIALGYAKRGFRVLPLQPNSKLPALKEWQHKASSDFQQINQWFSGPSDYNLGILTGGGFLVIDLDMKRGGNGIAEWEALCKQNGTDPWMTLIAQTPTGGRHLYFHTMHRHRNTAKKIAPSIDTRCEGGYVAAPSTKTGDGAYTWLNELAIAQAPAWLEQAAAGYKAKAPEPGGELPGYTRTALDNELDRVRNCAPGARNATLNAAAYALGSLVATPGSGLTRGEAENQLVAAAVTAGLPEFEAKRTADSGLSAGMRAPRVGLDIRSGATQHYSEPEGTGKKLKVLTTDDYLALFQNWGLKLRLNALTDDIHLGDEIMSDDLEGAIIAQVRDYGIHNKTRISVDHAREAIAILARTNCFNPVKDYLAGLQHGGTEVISRLAQFFSGSRSVIRTLVTALVGWVRR